ncbi:ceramide synthase 4 isoform X1 [Manis pentadactyla]|uniref:ceramide synthase 4 isoform X1 n=1 Tax=Manis pentadactyla TaxID=143292 RepID=UPI00255CC482|nr:ceramide synthase 4 isoform X1 [Manis pentadactyla]
MAWCTPTPGTCWRPCPWRWPWWPCASPSRGTWEISAFGFVSSPATRSFLLSELPPDAGWIPGTWQCLLRFVGQPLSRWLGVRSQARRPVRPNATLEKHFLQEGWRPEEPQMALLAAQCGLTLRQTQRWFRRRRNLDRPCLTKKFCEASWRFAFYLCSFLCGLSLLYHESWLWTPALCWDSYPKQPLKPALYCYYLLELSFYISLLMTLPFDIKRKDFREQLVHHFVAITLITFSYCSNLLRIGSLVLLLHDSSDYLLEACKMFNYTHRRHICDALFVIFSLVFLYTRLVLFPTQILYTTFFESIAESGPFFGYYFFNALLATLQLLHVFWSYLVLRMIFNFAIKGQVKDIRSDVEESDPSDREAAPEGPPLKNGAAAVDGPRSRAVGRLANGHTRAT